jgi:Ca2+-binding EF-hand superfamily protein
MSRIALLVLVGCARSYVPYGSVHDYDDWDENRDDALDRGEFARGFARAFSTWDRNGDGYVQGAEFSRHWNEPGAFDVWDLDGDRLLSQDELVRGLYDRSDVDGDDRLTEDEWRFQ